MLLDSIGKELNFGMKIPVSFKKREKNLYDYAKGKRNPSAYIKDLIDADMNKHNKVSNNAFIDSSLNSEEEEFEIRV